jgi:transcriptional regulator with XRE-family HTH domain
MAYSAKKSLPALWTGSRGEAQCPTRRRIPLGIAMIFVSGDRIEGQTPSSRGVFQPGRADIGNILRMALDGFDGNQAALALELGVTRATVSRWTTGQSVPDEGSCLRLAKITGRTAAEVFRLAGRDPHLLPTEPDLLSDAELAGRLRQWARRLGGLSVADRAFVVGVLDDVLKSLCQRLNQGDPPQDHIDTLSSARRRDWNVPALDGVQRQSTAMSSVDPGQSGLEPLTTSSNHQRPRSRRAAVRSPAPTAASADEPRR